MHTLLGVKIIGYIEVGIGFLTLVGVSRSVILGISHKPLEVLIFVLVTAIVSFSIGIGLLRYNVLSWRLLVFFSTVVILSKILIAANIITLTGALETTIPSSLKNSISSLYHLIVIIYLRRRSVREKFSI